MPYLTVLLSVIVCAYLLYLVNLTCKSKYISANLVAYFVYACYVMHNLCKQELLLNLETLKLFSAVRAGTILEKFYGLPVATQCGGFPIKVIL
jgi:hypothetical protein